MNLFRITAEVWNDFLLNIFPAVCINCYTTLVRNEQYICSKCKIALPRTNDYLDPTNRLFQKFAYEPKVKHVSSFLDYNKHGIARKLIHSLKYRGEMDIGLMLGRIYGADLRKTGTLRPDIIFPVPLHHRKLKKRGYNQSEMIALGLSESLEVEVDTNILVRKTYTSTQTKKSRVSRWENVGNVFEVVSPELLYNKRVMLVDDVLTTGATMGSLASQVAKCDVHEIYLVAMAAGS
ncbi:MAG: phosphoribosyltransferase family protein [Cyclobacteriaceae bacterium]